MFSFFFTKSLIYDILINNFKESKALKMNLNDYFSPDEKPLDNLINDGGFVGIFRTIACVGDSLSSGEFESTNENGSKGYHDMFDYSWGQYMARTIGTKVYNFSRGGMSAEEYYKTFADENGFFNKELACQAYIFALGVNDINRALRGGLKFGSLEDVDFDDLEKSVPSAVSYYTKVLAKYREIQPDAFFFLMTMPKKTSVTEEKSLLEDKHREVLYQLAERFPNTYVLDFRKYAPVYDEEFKKKFYCGGHMNACGYVLTAKMATSYIDYIIRHNMTKFKQVGFIGTPWKNTVDPAE